jgi:Ca2+-binding EF-hand superfamily protein
LFSLTTVFRVQESAGALCRNMDARYSYSAPDVSIFAGRTVRTPGSLPSGERVSLPYFGKSAVVPRDSARRPSYAAARSRAEREEARSQRLTARSSRSGTARSGYSRSSAAASRRKSSWEGREGWVLNPRFESRSQMLKFRRSSMLPHHTFDVDGDGVVSSEDFALAQAFDINKDGMLQDDERHELRKEMVNKLITKYRRLPHAESQEAENLIRRFTKDLDATVEASDFIHNYNKLHRHTAVINTHDSTNMHEATQPITVKARQEIADAFTGFDVNGDGVISHSEFRNGVSSLVKGMTPRTVEELIGIVDKVSTGSLVCGCVACVRR